LKRIYNALQGEKRIDGRADIPGGVKRKRIKRLEDRSVGIVWLYFWMGRTLLGLDRGEGPSPFFKGSHQRM